jgi:predicted transglutaminase-like cysteine proteinase
VISPTLEKQRFPLNFYSVARREQEEQLVAEKLLQNTRLTELKEELTRVNNDVHRLEERVRKRKQRVRYKILLSY